jgi:hypothetical protein
VDLAAGDTLRLGASRREYRLLWLSLREAFEMEDLLPPLIEEDKEEARTCQVCPSSESSCIMLLENYYLCAVSFLWCKCLTKCAGRKQQIGAWAEATVGGRWYS